MEVSIPQPILPHQTEGLIYSAANTIVTNAMDMDMDIDIDLGPLDIPEPVENTVCSQSLQFRFTYSSIEAYTCI